MILSSLEFHDRKTFCGITGYTMEILGVGLRGNDVWQSWMPISEWMIDRLDILRQANNGYVKEKDR